MSILTELLSKLNTTGLRKEVHPSLEKIVRAGVKINKRVLVSVSMLSVFILIGVVLFFFGEDIMVVLQKDNEAVRQPHQSATGQLNEKPQSVVTQQKPADEVHLPQVTPQPVVVTPQVQSAEVNKQPPQQPVKESQEAEKSEKKVERESEKGPPVELANLVPPPSEVALRNRQFKADSVFAFALEYEKKGLREEALEQYKNTLKLQPENHRILNKISFVLITMKRYFEAAKYAQEALALNANYVPALLNCGISYTEMHEIDMGERYFKQALLLAPQDREVVFNIAVFYEKANRLNEGFAMFSTLSSLGDSRGEDGINRITLKLDNTTR
ncbi:MAG: hypothetical protein H7844_14740 [Nitrospirae bacterium YQR-1]